jgi:hypothetical protein
MGDGRRALRPEVVEEAVQGGVGAKRPFLTPEPTASTPIVFV